jgi:HEAT repeat protein
MRQWNWFGKVKLASAVVGVVALAMWWCWRESPAQKVPRMVHEFDQMPKGRFSFNLFGPSESTWDAAWERLGPEAVPALCGVLNDYSHFACRYIVARRLGEIGDRRAVRPLIEALKDYDDCVRGDSATALGLISAPESTDALIAALQDESVAVRRRAAIALGRLHDHRAFDPLIRSLHDSDWLVRADAIASLGDLGDNRAVEPIKQLMAVDELSDIQENGIVSLQKLGKAKGQE